MPLPAVLGAVLGTGIRFVLKRPIYSAAGLIIGYEIIDDTGSVVGDILPDALGPLDDALNAAGIAIRDLAGAIGNEILEVIEGAGVSVVKGIDNAFNYVGDRFIRGKEPDIIAGFTIVILSIGAGVYLYNSMKSANDAFS